LTGRDEVSEQELLNKYMIQTTGKVNTGWSKEVFLHDGSINGLHSGRLYWDDNEGYRMVWNDNSKVPPEASRPEFEYVLDSLTEGF
jgi:hypothetical protein